MLDTSSRCSFTNHSKAFLERWSLSLIARSTRALICLVTRSSDSSESLTASSAEVKADRGAGMAGMVNKGLHAQASRFPIIQFATLAQPLILMGIYMFLPLILVFGRYSLQIMFLGALAIFTVKLWAVLWFIAMWIDEHLWAAMYPDAEHLLFNVLHLEFDAALKRSTLNTLLIGLYLGLPLIWSGMMGWASLHVVHGIDAMKHSAITAGMAAGQSGASIATRFVGGVGHSLRRGRG